MAGCKEKETAWVHAICVVTFDLELGQAMEYVHPPGASLSEEDKTSICYLAFPDSNSGCMGDTKFHFRFRHSPQGPLTPPYLRYNETCPGWLQAVPDYMYGYVYFRQVKDPNLPRGYFQKSVIILSRLPLVNFFLEACEVVAPEVFSKGEAGAEAAWKDIESWGEPRAAKVDLPLLDRTLQLYLGCPHHSPALPPDLFASLASTIPHLHTLWELVLIGEPVVVMAGSPEGCSKVVLALVSSIAPLRYCAEYRPYFTIHDRDFKEVTSGVPAVGTVLGVTNPFLSKSLGGWPHVVRVGGRRSGLSTRHQGFLRRDKALSRRLARNRPPQLQSALLRRHLLELTHSFMIPLERYVATLMPLRKSISPWRAPPAPWPFEAEAFLASVARAGPRLTTGVRGDWAGLYRRFLKSPHFEAWYRARLQAMTDKLRALTLEALSVADITHHLNGKGEVEAVDMLLRMREAAVGADPQTAARITSRMRDIVASLPEDLRSTLETTPS